MGAYNTFGEKEGGGPNASEHKVAFESLKLAAAATNLHGLGDLLRQTNG